MSLRQDVVFLLKSTDIFRNNMAAKAAKKSGEIIGRLRTYIPAGKASASPPLGPQLGQVMISSHVSLRTEIVHFEACSIVY